MQHNRQNSIATQDDEIRITPIHTSNLKYQTDSSTNVQVRRSKTAGIK